jgi:Rod binding domain-containing protein
MHQVHGLMSHAGVAQSVPQTRLVSATHEFEAQMLKELLKPLTSFGGLTGDQEEDGLSGSEGALGEFASEALGRSLSEHGGLGIADSVVRSLSQNGNRSESAGESKIRPKIPRSGRPNDYSH